MVAYTEAPPYGAGVPSGRVRGREQADRIIDEILARRRGLIVLNMHLGQWDLALIDLAGRGIPISVVMRREDEESARYAAAARRAAGISVIHPGSSAWTSVELLAALRRNEIVAIQGDRPYGGRTTPVTLFAADLAIPAGPWDLARAAGAPVMPAAMIIEGHRRFRHVFGDPIWPEGEAREDEGPSRLAAAMESMIRRHPTQWFNFYDVWASERAPEAGVRGRAPLAGALAGAAAEPDHESVR
jgi:KDO2-lipid IV(A) lauroyltransferase